MKKIYITLVSVLFAANVAAQNTVKTITVNAQKFSKELVSQWISNYEQNNDNVKIKLVSGKEAKNADITISSNPKANGTAQVITVAKYALLPVTNESNPYFNELTENEFNEKDLKHLFFELTPEEKLLRRGKALWSDRFKVISGSGKNAGAIAYARHFGYETADFRGNKIAGDDLYLLNAIEEDKEQITINNLTYIFDLQTRQLKQNIAILPLKLKKLQNIALRSGNLDNVLEILEEDDSDLIPVEELSAVVTNADNEVYDFLTFIINDGQQANHQYGFLQLDNKLAKNQVALLGNIRHSSAK